MNAEFAVAGLLLLQGGSFLDEAGDRISPDMFEDDDCKNVVNIALEMYDKGEYISLETFPKAHAASAVAVIQEGGEVSKHHAEHWLKRLRELNQYRKCQRVGEILRAATEESDLDRIITKASAQLEEAEADPAAVHDGREAVLETLSEIEDQLANPNDLLGLRTGFRGLSYYTNGMQEGTLWILAGAPSSGKSALALQIAKNILQEQDEKVHIISMEMTRQQCIRRWICMDIGKSLDDIVQRKNAAELDTVKTVSSLLSKLPFTVSDRPGLSLHAIKRQVKQAAKRGAKLVIIDHLKLLNIPRKDYRMELGKVTKALKCLAKDYGLCVLLLDQLNGRGVAAIRNGDEPQADFLGESSETEQDCDCCLMLDDDFNIFIVKNRDGARGQVACTFNGESQRFIED